jgi:hypothetical protein
MNNATDNAALEEMRLYFGWLDFSVFGIMLGFSALIGIYFGFCDKKQESRVDYLFGGKSMKTLPVAVSLVARSVLTFVCIEILYLVSTDSYIRTFHILYNNGR